MMMVAIQAAIDDLSELLAPVWIEVLFISFFTLGFALIPRATRKGKKLEKANEKQHVLHKQMEADVKARNNVAALKTWHKVKTLVPAPLETLKLVAQIFLEVQPASLVEEVLEHFSLHRDVLGNTKSVNTVLDVVARAGRTDIMAELVNEFKHRLHISPSVQMYEVLLGGYASVGDEKKVSQLCSEMNETRQKFTPRGYSLTIKGFLKSGLLDAALRTIHDMQKKGFHVPSFAVAQLFRTACQKERAVEVFEDTLTYEGLTLPADALVVLLEDCWKRSDLTLALRVEKIARGSNPPTALTPHCYDSLLKVCIKHADTHATTLFHKMQEEGHRISEGCCVGLLARCADSKFLRFAEEIVSFIRARKGMTLSSYSALMKVYAYCGLYDKACGLYDQLRAEGLEPDSMMYGCLMKFSVECGRTDLSRELFDKSPSVDIQNYMSMIRAAGRDKDIGRAFAVLEKLKASGATVDIAAYNCVLDACVSAGDMKRARMLMVEMQKIASLDIITYNTLLKGYCSKCDVRGAKDLFLEMERAGLAPNDVSYNCLINASVSTGNFREAWTTVAMMEKNGVAVDHYTISIMMKALKKAYDTRDVIPALELLDRSGVDVCSDEILLNTVLETCIRHRQLNRLEAIVERFTSSKMRPSVHTYGSVIKACSTIKRLDKCHQLWSLMVDECALEPNSIALGCMLDALVCNEKVEDAVQLLNKWKDKVGPNTVMYSTIIKGFTSTRQASRALDMWKEMKELGVSFNNVVFNALVDSQARDGAMDEVSRIVESMEPNGCTPDGITYSTIVKGYCIKGDLDKAFEVFRFMQKNGMAADSVVYNTIMDGCTRNERMDLADEVLKDMETNNIKPSNFTLGIMMKMYGRRHQLDKAFQVMQDVPKRHGFEVNTQVRTCLMCACLSNYDLDRAMMVFEDIKKAGGGRADGKGYSWLLSGIVRLGHLEQAIPLVEEAYGLTGKRRGLNPGQVIEPKPLEQLMHALQKNQSMQAKAATLLEKLRAAQVPMNGRLVSAALNNNRSR